MYHYFLISNRWDSCRPMIYAELLLEWEDGVVKEGGCIVLIKDNLSYSMRQSRNGSYVYRHTNQLRAGTVNGIIIEAREFQEFINGIPRDICHKDVQWHISSIKKVKCVLFRRLFNSCGDYYLLDKEKLL